MTIRAYLKHLARPYRRAAFICLALYVLAGIGMILVSFSRGRNEQLYVWAIVLTGVVYIAGFIGIVVSAVRLKGALRCPKCKEKIWIGCLGWQYCPLCGVDLDSEMDA